MTHDFHTYHDSLLAGHQGPYRMAMTIRQRFFIHNLMNKNKRYIDTYLKTKLKYKKNRPIYGRVPIYLSIDIKHMPIAFGGYRYLLVRDAQSIAETLIYRVIYLFDPPRQIMCDEATEFTSHIVQAILHMLNCKLKVITPYNHSSSKVERWIKTVSDIIVKHLQDNGQMWPLFGTTAAYTMNTFASEALNGFSLFKLVFVCDPQDLTSLSIPKIDTILVTYEEYFNFLLARAQMVGRLLFEWRT